MRQPAELPGLLLAGIGRVQPVPLADALGLAREVERAAGLRAGDERERLAIVDVQAIDRRPVAEGVVDLIEQGEPLDQARGWEVLRQIQARDLVAGEAGIAREE